MRISVGRAKNGEIELRPSFVAISLGRMGSLSLFIGLETEPGIATTPDDYVIVTLIDFDVWRMLTLSAVERVP